METRNITRRGVLLALAATGFAAASFTTRTLAQGSAAGAPGPVVMENEKVRVYAVVAKPGENVFGTGAQSHPPRLAVFMSDGKVSLAGAGVRRRSSITRQGDVVWDAGETHAAPNVGRATSPFIWWSLRGSYVPRIRHPMARPGRRRRC